MSITAKQLEGYGGVAEIDTTTYGVGGILDISLVNYASTIVVTCSDPTYKWFSTIGGIVGNQYTFVFEGNFGIHVFGKNKADTIVGSMCLIDEDYRYIVADADRTESVRLLQTSTYLQEVPSYSDKRSLIKKSKIYDCDFSRVATTDEFKVLSASIGTNAIVASGAGDFGIMRSQTGASALGRAGWNGQTGLTMAVNDSLPIVFMSDIRITNLATVAQNFNTRSGFFNVVTAFNRAMMVRHDSTSANWLLVNTVPGPSTTVVDSGIPVVAGTWYNIMVIVTDTEAIYLIGQRGGSYDYAGSITTNISANGFVYGQMIQKTAGTTARDIFTDYGKIYKYVNR